MCFSTRETNYFLIFWTECLSPYMQTIWLLSQLTDATGAGAQWNGFCGAQWNMFHCAPLLCSTVPLHNHCRQLCLSLSALDLLLHCTVL